MSSLHVQCLDANKQQQIGRGEFLVWDSEYGNMFGDVINYFPSLLHLNICDSDMIIDHSSFMGWDLNCQCVHHSESGRIKQILEPFLCRSHPDSDLASVRNFSCQSQCHSCICAHTSLNGSECAQVLERLKILRFSYHCWSTSPISVPAHHPPIKDFCLPTNQPESAS